MSMIKEVVITEARISHAMLRAHMNNRPVWYGEKMWRLHKKPEIVGEGERRGVKFTLHKIGLS